jgi:hypothetical protein
MGQITFTIIWYIIGFFGTYVIMRREQDYEIKESTVEDIVGLLVFPVFGIMVWMFYGMYLLAISDVWHIKVFKRKKLTKFQKKIINHTRRSKISIEVPLGFGKTKL